MISVLILLPGSGKTELYRGLSCVPGNLLAQFLGGDGGVSLPTYPVHKIKETLSIGTIE